MRRYLGAALGCALLSTTAVQAADLPVKAVPIVQPSFNWSGWYAGGHLGAIRSHTTVGAYDGLLFPPFAFGAAPIIVIPGLISTLPGVGGHDTSWLGGVQIGHNWQRERWVYGFEVDVSATSLKDAGSVSATRFGGTTTSQTVTVDYSAKLDWMASLRGRLGMTFDRVLLYGTAGAAIARINAGSTVTVANGPAITLPAGTFASTASNSRIRFGWTLGAGVEWALNAAWSLAAEYRHTQFGSTSAPIVIPDGLGTTFATSSTSLRVSTDQVTARVNYHFAARP